MKEIKKKNNNSLYLLVVIFLLIGIFFLISIFRKTGPTNLNSQVNKQNCVADDCLLIDNLEYPVEELPADVKIALTKAIDDEYKALAVYQAVIGKFGNVRPFSMIKNAEEQHIASLLSLFDKYGLIVPVNNWTNKISVPTSLTQACQLGVEAEIANALLYLDELLPAVKSYPDITTIFTNLMNASQEKHLPAFEKCN